MQRRYKNDNNTTLKCTRIEDTVIQNIRIVYVRMELFEVERESRKCLRERSNNRPVVLLVVEQLEEWSSDKSIVARHGEGRYKREQRYRLHIVLVHTESIVRRRNQKLLELPTQ